MTETLTILGLESSCDDTAAAVVRQAEGAQPEVLSSVVFGQTELHSAFGGVVPEIAARAHAEKLDICVRDALAEAGLSLKDMDAVAVTAGPGLIGGVMSGVMCAKGIAAATGLPLIGVNHLAGHALTPRLTDGIAYPYLMLLVSGGHCQYLLVRGTEDFTRLGGTIDDAPGEAFDKTARLLGLPQPGGPSVQAEAATGDPKRFRFPRPLLDRPDCNLSFSGLKTALMRMRDQIVAEKGGLTRQDRADLCAGFQAAVVDTLAEKTRRAIRHVSGSTARGANRRRRRRCRGEYRHSCRARDCLHGGRCCLYRAAAAPVHRQCRDDCLCRAGTLQSRCPRWSGPDRPPPLALGPKQPGTNRIGPQGSQGMSVSVLGSGAFGTALAISLAGNGPVTLWARSADHAKAMQDSRRNEARLPGVDLPETLTATADAAQACTSEVLLLAVPMQKLRSVLEEHKAHLTGKTLVACCKGIELHSGLGPVAVMQEVLPESNAALLTGPSFAADIACGLPTALTLACGDADLGKALQEQLTTANLRLYRTTDTIGAELGGALKNVMAIACGAVIGAGLGDSARAALMTRGYAEMQRMALACGAKSETMAGLSGFGDLALTCTSDLSRNYRLGLSIGRGESFDSSITVEGAATAHAVAEQARKMQLDMPITLTVTNLLDQRLTISEAAGSFT